MFRESLTVFIRDFGGEDESRATLRITDNGDGTVTVTRTVNGHVRMTKAVPPDQVFNLHASETILLNSAGFELVTPFS